MAAIESHLKQAMALRAAGALGRGALNFGKGFASPFVQNGGQLAKLTTGAAVKRFGNAGLAGKAYNATRRLPARGLRWERKTGMPGMVGNAMGGMAAYGTLPGLAATAMGGDQADGAALALAQLRQQYAQIPWYQKAFGGTGPMDDLIQQSDPRILASLNKLYAR